MIFRIEERNKSLLIMLVSQRIDLEINDWIFILSTKSNNGLCIATETTIDLFSLMIVFSIIADGTNER
jgi:hypothetical protein